jgi:hypothetical protein
MSANDEQPLPARYPVTQEDGTRFHEKPIKFEEVPVDSGPEAGTLIAGQGMLMVYTDGREGWAEIHTDAHLGPIPVGRQIVALSEETFRRIQETPEGLFLRGRG